MLKEFAMNIRWEFPIPKRSRRRGYTLDAALMARPGNVDIQLDLFLDYANNVKLYPAFQQYFPECEAATACDMGASAICISFRPAPRLLSGTFRRRPFNSSIPDISHSKPTSRKFVRAMRDFLAKTLR